jgi:hypothetical protein
VSKWSLFVCALLVSCTSLRRPAPVATAYSAPPVAKVLGHLDLASHHSCLYVLGDSLHYLLPLQSRNPQTELAAPAEQLESLEGSLEFTQHPANKVILSPGGLRSESSYQRILIDRSTVQFDPQAQADLLALFINKLESDGILVLLSRRSAAATPNSLEKTNSELANSYAFRKMSIDTSLAPHLQALILLK